MTTITLPRIGLEATCLVGLMALLGCDRGPEAQSPDDWATKSPDEWTTADDGNYDTTTQPNANRATQTPTAPNQGTSSTASQLDQGERMSFEDADSNDDKRLSQREMSRDGVPVVITTWDSDADGNLAGDEMYVIFFDSLDANRDQSIDRSEYDKASAGWNENGSSASGSSTDGSAGDDAFTKADANRDGAIDRSEAPALADELAFFQTWDTDGDGKLSDKEITTHLYAAWDVDDDGYIDYAEWITR